MGGEEVSSSLEHTVSRGEDRGELAPRCVVAVTQEHYVVFELGSHGSAILGGDVGE